MEKSLLGPRAGYSSDLVQFVVEAYQLHQVKAVEDIGGTYSLNLSLEIETTQSNFVLRVYRPWITRKRLAILQKIKEKLYLHHFPVVLPETALSGISILEYQNRLLEVEKFVTHDLADPDWDQYQKAFAMMASFHDFLRENIDTSTISFVSPQLSNHASPRVILEWLNQFEDVVTSQEDFETCKKTRELLLKINRTFEEKVRTLPYQLTHGDWRIGNILFRNDQVVAILDFDFLDVRERVFDLAYSLYVMYLDLEPYITVENLAWYRVSEMLKAYNQVTSNKLTQAEIEMLPLELALVPLFWVGEALVVPDLISTLPNCAEGVEWAEWILEHGNSLLSLFRFN